MLNYIPFALFKQNNILTINRQRRTTSQFFDLIHKLIKPILFCGSVRIEVICILSIYKDIFKHRFERLFLV